MNDDKLRELDFEKEFADFESAIMQSESDDPVVLFNQRIITAYRQLEKDNKTLLDRLKECYDAITPLDEAFQIMRNNDPNDVRELFQEKMASLFVGAMKARQSAHRDYTLISKRCGGE